MILGEFKGIDNIQKNFNLMGHINVVANNDIETSLNIQDEIYGKHLKCLQENQRGTKRNRNYRW